MSMETLSVILGGHQSIASNGSSTERNIHIELGRPQDARPARLQVFVNEEHRTNDERDVIVEVDIDAGPSRAEDVLAGLHVGDDRDLREPLQADLDVGRGPSDQRARLRHVAIAVREEHVVSPEIETPGDVPTWRQTLL